MGLTTFGCEGVSQIFLLLECYFITMAVAFNYRVDDGVVVNHRVIDGVTVNHRVLDCVIGVAVNHRVSPSVCLLITFLHNALMLHWLKPKVFAHKSL